jgi:hypothetical protein
MVNRGKAAAEPATCFFWNPRVALLMGKCSETVRYRIVILGGEQECRSTAVRSVDWREHKQVS